MKNRTGYEIYDLNDEADTGYYDKLFDILIPPQYKNCRMHDGETEVSKNKRRVLYEHIEISEKYDVVRVYVNGEMVGIEMEDRFPSEQLVAKVRLMLL